MPLFTPDVSEFQNVLTSQYGRRVLIMRVAFGAHYADAHYRANAAQAAALYHAGKIDGVIVYQVYLASATPQEQYAFAWKLIGATVPPWLLGVMIDVERWSGQSYAISGNHSTALNTLYALHAHRMGSWTACIGYGNKGDLAALWPTRDKRCRVIKAAYSSIINTADVPGAMGQQYTDGSARWPVPKGYPTATAPFGHCDHNVFPRMTTGAQLRTFMRPPATKPPASAPTTPAVPAPYYPSGVSNKIVEGTRHYALGIFSNGRAAILHDGKVIAYVTTTAP